MKRGDRVMFLLFAVLVLMSAAVWLWQNYILPDGAAAEVLQNGHVIKKIDLRKANGEEYRFASHKCVNLVRAERGRIAVISADCPDRDCVRRGYISRPGESAVCLPGRLVIRISGAGEVDGVTY